MIAAGTHRSVALSDIAITQALGFASLVFTGILSYFMFRAKSASELAVIQANAASEAAKAAAYKVDHVATAAETAVVNVGVAVNKVNTVARAVETGQQERTAKLDGLATEVAEVKQLGKETHVLVDGQMGVVLEIGLEAAQGRYDDNPTPENKTKLEAAQKKCVDHAARMKTVEVSAAVGDPLVTGPLKGPPK